ncbi:MAG: hypothetical protein ABI821_18615 [Pseudomonadota bacterium]
MTARSRAIQSNTSDRRQPIARPWNLSFFGNLPSRHNPESTQRGRRVRRATSWDLRSSLIGGKRSLTQGETMTFVALLTVAIGLPAIDG